MLKSILFSILITFSSLSHAWIVSTDVTIKEMIQWEANDDAVIVLSNDVMCYIPLTEKQLYTFVLATYLAGKPFTSYCYDPIVDKHGYPAHKLHRINSK